MDPQDIPLRDIHMPNLISWWPLASGWWVLLGVVVATVTIAGAIGWWRKRHRVRRAALREFSGIEKNFAEHRDTHRLARDLSRLTRRTALAYCPGQGTAALTGAAWIDHLKSLTEASQNADFVADTLNVAAYRRHESLDAERVLDSFREWFRSLQQPRTSSR
jgi:hypothetical protein